MTAPTTRPWTAAELDAADAAAAAVGGRVAETLATLLPDLLADPTVPRPAPEYEIVAAIDGACATYRRAPDGSPARV